MLTMPEIHYIKHLRETDDLSISEISRKVGKNWRTVKKYADGEVYPSDFDINFTKTGMMYDSEFGEIVDLWLEEDSKLRRKERRTNKKIFNQLKTEYNFKGSYRTVCEYIQLRKPQMKIEKSTRYERLEHPAGEAQVDFGNMTVVKDGAYKDIKALLLSFPYSNAAFVYPLPSENTECFLEGLKQLFHQAGGVPTHLRIDNLSAAVVTVGKGDNRTYTDAFLQFQMHYNFEVQPCNPYSGHEKGNVERKVCYTRNNWFTTAPIMESFSQLAQWLEVQAMEDQKRLHYEKEVMIEDLWNDDKAALKPLPLEDLTVFSLDTTTVNKYGEITVDQECFVLRKTNVKQVIIIKKEWNQFTCYTAEGENIFTEYRPYMHTNRPIPWEEIFEDWEKKPRVIRYSRFFKYLPQRVQDYLLFHKDERKACLTGLKYLIQKYSLQQLHLLLENEEWLKKAPHELDIILQTKQVTYPQKWKENHTPPVLIDYETDLQQYDRKLCPTLERGSFSL
ncbi:IS21 family transposase [Bacillus wiedmannii]|uniref:IS21 family transposase n=1 Tax=Bacillus wiedmannii TaxID=1890302 RepID=UPI000BF0D47E|nr:IS21 family transposase [Bacillus wiedmannii]PEJ76843.1 integrase [Bacillus wiedmannii]